MRRQPDDPRSSEDLLVSVRSDPAALEALYRRHVGATVRFAVRRCGTPEEVHDLVAATWLEVIDASRRFDPRRGKALPWILGVAANLANDARRRAAREHAALQRLNGRRVLEPDDMERLEEAIHAEGLSELTRRGLAAMSPADRELVEFAAFASLVGVSGEEAAAALGLEPAAFRMRLSRARRRLRAVLGSALDEAQGVLA
jgi:RNA polymerase sigma factor (sigma-70 family)